MSARARSTQAEDGAPVTVIRESYSPALGAGLLDGVGVTISSELDFQRPGVWVLLSYLAVESLPVWFVGEGLGDLSADLVSFVPDGTRAGELGFRATLDL